MGSINPKRDRQPETDAGHYSEPKKARTDNDTVNFDPPTLHLQRPKKRVVLNPADCDIDFNIEDDGLKGSALCEKGFAYCWSGARANVGITGGRYFFACKIIAAQPVDMVDTPPNQQHVCRIGISRGDNAVGKLGETLHSFGYGGTAKFSNADIFKDYGETFGVGDTIVCAVDLKYGALASIQFSKNGKWVGRAKHFGAGPTGLGIVGSPRKEPQWQSALFPHVLLKNVVVQMQFSVEDGLVPEKRYKPWDLALDDGKAIMGPAVFSDVRDCEVMMMVGLPASGKSTWAERWVKEHPEKRYVLLGTSLVLEKMKVPGISLQNSYGEDFYRLMGEANAILDILLSRAAKTPRNYIIDQTNVFRSSRKHKLRPFSNFHKIAVVVFPKPVDLMLRACEQFKTGNGVPADAEKNTLANFALPMSMDMPGSDEDFEQVIFPELDQAESEKYLEEMKHAWKADSMPYSQEKSVASYSGRPVPNQRALSVGGHQESSHQLPSRPSSFNQSPCPIKTGYQVTHGFTHTRSDVVEPSYVENTRLSLFTNNSAGGPQAGDLHRRAPRYARPSYGALREIIQYLRSIYPSASQYFRSVHPSVFQYLQSLSSSELNYLRSMYRSPASFLQSLCPSSSQSSTAAYGIFFSPCDMQHSEGYYPPHI